VPKYEGAGIDGNYRPEVDGSISSIKYQELAEELGEAWG